ncbi:MAG: repair protein SbcD/Mre11 [Thermoanaerobacteraceae bacterium]|jgi:DNA repair exonuclease SbcCD nuclease subunit|uniref:Metallophosphoesterase n=1 Tax=Biomaibacter acetigenes TaxID=2316383 RepID=A0A3G2R551_9FIRM|nr:metallophosphoesterase [Biomaibacter acetigenes]MDK2877550.1 repair protein SbcD/Mre11 [Thermoanaerobacteraceae bacterium]RKL62033.1 metallophosphoesterase [Thermoanaerobacteraceae bacterium SP2]AYO30532.1 metallophosphoesterase [Biomaibacter acetigenes]MDN5301652.1 repair protein SbcD/Mre11 [Thermoanaerobacteraceae bacterium]MDN5311881.1 repair protein SbcD/Mre11 [Thermoanaerobacteraceae bacterium]
MRFLFFTDTHIKGTNPQNRKDNFLETLQKKIKEVLDIAVEKKVDVILHGGDIFDRPDVSPSLVREFVVLLNKYSIPVYAVAGNHDIYGQNPLTVNRTMLGLLDGMGIIKLIQPGEKLIFEDGPRKIQLTGQPYFYGIDGEDKRQSYMVEKSHDVNFAIHMVHGMLLEKPFFEGMSYTLIEEIVGTQADITLSGHYHTGFNTKVIDGKFFINPGSLVRINNSMNELLRMPKVIIIDINENIDIIETNLNCALPGDEVLDRTKVQALAFREKKLAEFIQGIYSTGQYNTININKIIEEISRQQNIKEEVVKEALQRIGAAQEMLSQNGGEEYPEVS